MDLGGIETFLMNLYRCIDRNQIQFDFLCHNRIKSAYSDEILSLGGRMYCIPGITHGGFLNYEHNLYKFFCDHKEYKVVHSHMNDLNGVILKQAYKAGIKKRFSHIHTVYRNKDLLFKLRVSFFKLYLNRYTTHAFACSKLAGDRLYSGKHKKTFVVIPNAIDTELFQFSLDKRETIRKTLGIDNNPLIGHVGRFAPVKNHSFMLACFKEFIRSFPDAKLVFIGKGDLENESKVKAEALGIKKSVLFLGNRTDVNDILSALDVFLFPSISEGLPVSVVEAQASGLQILASDSISSDSRITDLYYSLSLSEPLEKWSEKIKELYLNSHNYDRAEYSQKVLEKGFDIKQTAIFLTKLYMMNAEGVNNEV